MRTKFGVLVTTFSLICSGGALIAHHSFSTEYDGNKTFNLKGTVSKVEWTNPHARFYVDLVDESGKMVTWNMELAQVDPAWGLTPAQIGSPGFGQSDDRPYAERQRHPADYDAQASQREIAVHALEHLASTDRGVIMFRKIVHRKTTLKRLFETVKQMF